MSKLTRYNRKIKLTLIKVTAATCLFCLFYIPVVHGKGFNTDVGYYTVVLDGKELGAVNSPEEANQAFRNARMRLSGESDAVLYMDPEFQVYEQSKWIGTRLSETDIETEIYNNLSSCLIKVEKQQAYTVRINDFTVTLQSKDDVIRLIEAAKQKFDQNNEFQVTLQSEKEDQYKINMVKAGFGENNSNIVAATLNGKLMLKDSEGAVEEDGLTSISFLQEVIINQTSVTGNSIMSVEEALEIITKEKEEKTFYTVVSGDCLSIIAVKTEIPLEDLYKLNPGLTDNTIIMPGDQIVITVPTPELSIITTERQTYEEDYNAPVVYVDNDTMYRGTSNVIQTGTTGHRQVTADITYVNGVDNGARIIIDEVLMEESIPQIVEVGTLTPPTYVKPLYGGSFSSGFGYRWGTMHNGVDWACSIGTPIMASASGTVIRASWFAGYGYCVDIRHVNGVVTRYAHLNSMSVSVGQAVEQYQRIGNSGNTGNSTGPHLHFEVIINGSAVNPLSYVNKY